MDIAINSLIQYLDKTSDATDKIKVERVLYMDAHNDAISVIGMNNENSLPEWRSLENYYHQVSNGFFDVLEVDPWIAKPRHFDELSRAEISGLVKATKVIESFTSSDPSVMYDSNKRGRIIYELVKNGEATKPTIYLYLKRFWRGGQTSFALIPKFKDRGGKGKLRLSTARDGHKRGRPSIVSLATGQSHGMNIDEASREKLISLGKEYYEKLDELSLKKVYDDYLAVYFNKGFALQAGGDVIPIIADVVPSFDQFRYWYTQERDRDKVIISRKGRRAFDLEYRPIDGESTSMAFGPGSIYQIDATIGDVFLVSSLNRRHIIGRPVIYVVIDVFSRMVVGFYVGLEGPSWLGMMLAFQNVAADKVKYCQSMGINISEDKWPVKHLPGAVIGDRGELESKNASLLVTGFNVRVSNTPPYRPDWKGIVERHFRLINEKIVDWLPGAVKLNARGERDYRLDSALTLGELRKLLTLTFLEYNETHILSDYKLEDDMRRDRIVPTPLKLWDWGIKNRSGALRYFSEESVRLGLLPRSNATVTARGLYYEKRYFTSEYIEKLGWRGKARDEAWKVRIAYHPWMPSIIWLIVEDGNELIQCNEINQRGISSGEHIAEKQLEDALSSYDQTIAAESMRQTHIQYQNEANKIKENAKQEVKNMPKSKSNKERLSNIGANRQAERELERQLHVGEIPDRSNRDSSPQETISQTIPLFSSEIDTTLDSVYSNLSDSEEE